MKKEFRFTQRVLRENRLARYDPDLAGTFIVQGKLFEGLGKWDEAIEWYQYIVFKFERIRQSFQRAERIRFFRQSFIRQAYWGLIRTLAKRAQLSGDTQNSWQTLQAMERYRARQLGDRLDPDNPNLFLPPVAELREQVGEETLVLSYVLTDDALVILALSHDAHRVVVVPYDHKSFGTHIRQVAQMLADRHSSPEKISQDLLKVSESVIQPVADLLRQHSRMYVLPDRELNLLPFEIFPLSMEADIQPLLVNKLVHILPSLKTWRAIRKGFTSARPRAGFFGVGDPRYSHGPKVEGLSESDLQTLGRSSSYLQYFQPLPETGEEVRRISSLFDGEPVRMLLGSAAKESVVKQERLEAFQYIHLATHGILGGEVPGVEEPALVLGEEEGEDGYLTASEAERLTLQADLAVLSACNTGTGELVIGEGVLGMSRAYLLAGARQVVVSLWPVASRETTEFMVKFYQNLRGGQEVEAALRQAKLQMMGYEHVPTSEPVQGLTTMPPETQKASSLQRPSIHPYYWAPFVLVGAA